MDLRFDDPSCLSHFLALLINLHRAKVTHTPGKELKVHM
jgi:hypothetical protein